MTLLAVNQRRRFDPNDASLLRLPPRIRAKRPRLFSILLCVAMLSESVCAQDVRRVVINEELDRIAATTDQRIGVELAIGSRLFGKLGRREEARFTLLAANGEVFKVRYEEIVAFLRPDTGATDAIPTGKPGKVAKEDPPPGRLTLTGKVILWTVAIVGGALVLCKLQNNSCAGR